MAKHETGRALLRAWMRKNDVTQSALLVRLRRAGLPGLNLCTIGRWLDDVKPATPKTDAQIALELVADVARDSWASRAMARSMTADLRTRKAAQR